MRERSALAVNPSLAAVRRVCLAGSQCADQATTTVRYLLDRGLHAQGGPTYRIDSVEYQGTLDDVPLEEALEVIFIVRLTVTSVTKAFLVRDDGSVDSPLPFRRKVVVGRQYSQSLALGRATPRSRWKLSHEGEYR